VDPGRIMAAAQFQLIQQVMDVIFNRARSNVESSGDLLVAEPIPD
jgi:hypothetical protein